MGDFRILSNAAGAGLKFADMAVDAHVGQAAGAIADAAVVTTKGVTNPLHLLTFGEIGTGVFRPEIFSRTTSRAIQGNGTSAFDDAVRSLVNMGEHHGVEGISLGTNPNYSGLIRFKGDLGYVGGSPVTERIGKQAAMRIDEAARRVLDFVEAGA